MSDKILYINNPSSKFLELIKLLGQRKEDNREKLLSKKELFFSKKNVEIFSNAILNPRKPSDKLLEAAKQYKDLLNKNV